MDNYDEAGIYQYEPQPIIFTRFAIEAIRRRSYKNWSKQIEQTPQELSEAGFYYTGRDDSVVCFCCKMGFQQWEEYDVPWEQHVLHSEHCNFLTLMKGSKYIEEVKAKFQAAEPATVPLQEPSYYLLNFLMKSVAKNLKKSFVIQKCVKCVVLMNIIRYSYHAVILFPVFNVLLH